MTLNIFRFRTECISDASAILSALLDSHAQRPFLMNYYCITQDKDLPDCEVSLGCNLCAKEIAAIINRCEDCHVAAESIDIAEMYTGERTGKYL